MSRKMLLSCCHAKYAVCYFTNCLRVEMSQKWKCLFQYTPGGVFGGGVMIFKRERFTPSTALQGASSDW